MTVVVTSPTFDHAVLPQPAASVEPTCANGLKCSFRYPCLVVGALAPTRHCAGFTQPATVELAGAYRTERPSWRVCFARSVPPPTLDCSIRPYSASAVLPARTYGDEHTVRCIRLPSHVIAPAFDRAARTYPTAVIFTSAHRTELATEGVCSMPPAFNYPAASHPTAVIPTRIQRTEFTAGRVRLSILITAPTLDRPAQSQPAAVVPACAHSAELTAGRVRLPVVVVSPALNRPAHSQPASVQPARAHYGKRAVWRPRLAIPVVSPALDRPVYPQPASVQPAHAHGAELTVR